MVLYALHRLNFPLKVEMVTNIIHFTDDLCKETMITMRDIWTSNLEG